MSSANTDPQRSHQNAQVRDDVEDEGRREALKAVRKYAAFVAGTSTVILSADEALAQQNFCSIIDPDRFPWLYYWFCGGDRPGRGRFRQNQPNGNFGLQRFNRETNGFNRR